MINDSDVEMLNGCCLMLFVGLIGVGIFVGWLIGHFWR